MSRSEQEYIAQLEQEVSQLRRARASGGRDRFSWRQFLARMCLVLGLVALVPASVLIWANRSITDPQRYIELAGPLINQASVQRAITKAASDAILGQVDVPGTVSRALPDNAQFLAGPIASQVENYTRQVISQIVASQQFADVWVRVNQRAQERFMQIAQSGRSSPTVNVNDLYAYISDNLAGTRLAPLASRNIPPQIGNVEVVTIPALAQIPHFMTALDDLRWLFFGLAVSLLVLALVLARHRRQMAMTVGVGWVVAALATFIVIRLARVALLGSISDPVYNDAAATVWRSVLTPLATQVAVMAAAGIAISLVAWLAGPAGGAVAVRHRSQQFLAGWRMRLWPALGSSPVAGFLRRRHVALLWALPLLGLVLVLLFVPLTLASFVGIVLLLGVLLLVLEFLVVPDPPSS